MNFVGAVPGIPDAIIRRVDAIEFAKSDSDPVNAPISARPGEFLLSFPRVGRFRVTRGTLIEFAPAPDADPGMVRLLLNGSARGALIHQRRELPLHAATLVPPGGGAALSICGPSGAGKSTLAIELSRRGWLLVADDTTRVTWTDNGPLAWPSRDSIKLWRDACEANGIEVANLERVTRELDKYYVQVPALSDSARLGVIVELVQESGDAELLNAAEKMRLITRNTYRPLYMRAIGNAADHVRLVAQVASSCKILKLSGAKSRPAAALADEVAAAMI